MCNSVCNTYIYIIWIRMGMVSYSIFLYLVWIRVFNYTTIKT
uniref:Uncharacterized protein n=1 Tax=virus sp. ctML55 TaxID=2827627 RepID=A0A8S5RHV0_9VIRU|nr:MAG TPA: hypothetical protein [virus sp. ctML55]DAW91976.1 MAG TPA: hypothetical protein [Bacteriophage sp.]